MNFVNRAMTGIFDVVLTPFELLGTEAALILLSGIVGILCLILFKYISWQDGIKGVKDRIKGNMIAIRIYQDDLIVVFKAVVSVFFRNLQYLGLNFGPILPLLIPFVLVLSQLVVRYAYDPLEVVREEEVAGLLSGEGTMVMVKLKKGEEAKALDLSIGFPEGIRPLTPVVRSGSEGLLFVEVVATRAVADKIAVKLDGRVVATKEVVAGEEPTRKMQPSRVSNFWLSWLLPAEDVLDESCPVESIEFTYPARALGIPFMPAGELGIVLIFFLASMVFGVAVLKPLNIQI